MNLLEVLEELKRMQNLKEQIKKGILELKGCNLEEVLNLSDTIEKYLELSYEKSRDSEIINEINPWISGIASKCNNSYQLNEIINKLFEKFYSNKIYPAYFEAVKDPSDPVFNNKDEFLSFYRYCLFMEIISQVPEINLIETLIQKSENFGDLRNNLKRIVLFCFKNTKKIPWYEKRKLFWEWKQNPLLVFWKSKDCKWFIKIPFPGSDEKCSNVYDERLKLFDSFLLLKDIPELKKEVMEKETIFRHCEDYVNRLNEKIYCNFLKNKEDANTLIELFFLLTHFHEWRDCKGLFKIKNDHNEKKNKELCRVLFLIDSVPEVSQSIKELECSETPDFIIKTHDNKKIALELTAIDLPEEVKSSEKVKSCEKGIILLGELKPPLNDIVYGRIYETIEEKRKKMERYKTNYNECWLLLYSESSLSAIKQTFLNEFAQEFGISPNLNYLKNNFHRIYYLMGVEKIKELNSGKEYQIDRNRLNEWKKRL